METEFNYPKPNNFSIQFIPKFNIYSTDIGFGVYLEWLGFSLLIKRRDSKGVLTSYIPNKNI